MISLVTIFILRPILCLVIIPYSLKNSKSKVECGSWNPSVSPKAKASSYWISFSKLRNGKMTSDGNLIRRKPNLTSFQDTLWTRYWLAVKNSIWEFMSWLLHINRWLCGSTGQGSHVLLTSATLTRSMRSPTLSCTWPTSPFRRQLTTTMRSLEASGSYDLWNFSWWLNMGLSESTRLLLKFRIWLSDASNQSAKL